MIDFEEGELENISTQLVAFLLDDFLEKNELGYLVYHTDDFAYKTWIDNDNLSIVIEKYLNTDKEVE